MIMIPDSIIDTEGFTVKKELLVNVNTNCFENTLVLETSSPFPGYYENEHYPIDSTKGVKTIFFVTQKLYSVEEVERMTKGLRAEFKQDFDASPGIIIIKNTSYNCIRIYDFEKHESVIELQSWYSLKGVDYLISTKKINAVAKIKIIKQYLINKIGPGIFQDSIYSSRYFLEISDENLSWSDFQKITKIVKSNVADITFDAALTVLIDKNTIRHFVRFFSGEKTKFPIEVMQKIRNNYNKAIKEIIE